MVVVYKFAQSGEFDERETSNCPPTRLGGPRTRRRGVSRRLRTVCGRRGARAGTRPPPQGTQVLHNVPSAIMYAALSRIRLHLK